MRLYGGIYFDERGISTSIRGMHMQTELLSRINENVTGFNQVGYQRTTPVISSFAEYIGVHALSTVKNDEVGRLTRTEKPLDFALAKPGYFQYKTPEGIKLTRDGRFKLDKNGNLLTLQGYKVLGANGQGIRFKSIPEDLNDIKVGIDGKITVTDKNTFKTYEVGRLSVVSNKGDITQDVDVRQGFVEASNVSLQEEIFSLVPVRRNFEANRQLYITQDELLNKTIQQLGSSS